MYIAWGRTAEPQWDQHLLISESEQENLPRIERLLSHPVDKADLPEKVLKDLNMFPARNAHLKKIWQIQEAPVMAFLK